MLNDAENRIAQMQTSATGTIRIGATDTIFEYFLADKIVEFHEKFPAVKIDLVAGFTPDTIEKLKAKRCDVAFVNLPITVDNELQLHTNCMRLNDVFIASDKFKELKDKTIPLAKLKKYPMIMMDEATVARRSLDNFMQSLAVDIEPAMEIGNWDLMKRLVLRGMGIGVIPREYVTRRLQDGSLFEVKTDPELPARSVGMLLPKNASVSYALQAFINMFHPEW
jgi:DNA-binding transcriptional LysR family regulator